MCCFKWLYSKFKNRYQDNSVAPLNTSQQENPNNRRGNPSVVSYDFENLQEMRRCLGDLEKIEVVKSAQELASITVKMVNNEPPKP